MFKRTLGTIALICILPHCGGLRHHTASNATPGVDDASDETPTAEHSPQQEVGLIGSFLKKIQEYRQAQDTISNKSYQELRVKLKEYQEQGDLVTALKYAEKMYAQCEDEQELTDMLLVCADLCFSQKNYKKASMLYNEFVRLYPRVPEKSAYAWYRAILCSENQQTNSADRDQTVTQETIVLAESFLKQGELFAQYHQQVMEILERCRLRIVEHELAVVRFYVHRGSLQAAEKRLASIRTEWETKCIGAEPRILIHEYLVAHAQHNSTLMEQKAAELGTKWTAYLTPDILATMPYATTIMHMQSLLVAHQDQKHSSFVDRF